MEVNTEWQANTFAFSAGATITVVSKVPEKPDLAAQYIKHDKACIQVGDTVPIKYAYKNIGLSTTTPFKVQLKVDGTVIHTENVDDGANKDILLGATVNYKFTSTAKKSFTLVVDSGNAVDEETKTNNSISEIFEAKSDCTGGGTGGPEVITGTLEVELPTVLYGKSNYTWLRNVTVSGGNSCKLIKGDLIYSQGSHKRTYSLDRSGTFSDQFVASPYNGFSTGTVSVQYDILTSCGTKKTIGPGSFQVIADTANRPPQFEPSWFEDSYYTGYGTKTTMVPVGEKVSLGPVKRPAIPALNDNGTPYDPDGDDITFYYDFENSSSSWIRWIGDTKDGLGYYPYQTSFNNLTTNQLGAHTVAVQAFDGRGGVAGPYNITLNVVDQNPVPVIDLPTKVVEGRTYTPEISCAKSWSPYKNRSITSCDWHGTKQPMYPTAGNYAIQLDVTDNTGLRSKETAIKTLAVQPDLPPVPRLVNPMLGIRNAGMHFQDTSYSPDDDPISEHVVTMSYDTNNDGNFAGEVSWSVTLDAQGRFSYTPAKVGKYAIRIYLKEGLGYQRSAQADFQFEVINDAPDASFYVEGSDFFPPEIVTQSFTGAMLLQPGSWKTSTVSHINKYKEYLLNEDGSLETGKSFVSQSFLPNFSGASSLEKSFSCTWPTRRCDIGPAINPNFFMNIYGTSLLNVSDNDPNTYVPVSPPVKLTSIYHWAELTYGPIVDTANDRVLYRAFEKVHRGGDWHTYVFRLSDLEQQAKRNSQGNTTFTAQPLYSKTEFIPEEKYGNDQGKSLLAPIPESVWVNPPEKRVNVINGMPRASYDNAYTNKELDLYTSSNYKVYGGDNNGNRFHYSCKRLTFEDGHGDTYYQDPCDLQLLNPQGGVIWTIPQIFKLYDYGSGARHIPPSDLIAYMTLDGTKMIINKKLYSVATGQLLSSSLPNLSYIEWDKMIGLRNVMVRSESGDDYYQQWDNIYLDVFDLNTLSYSSSTLICSDCAVGGAGKGSFSIQLTADKKVLAVQGYRGAWAEGSKIVVSGYDLSGNLISQYEKTVPWSDLYPGSKNILMVNEQEVLLHYSDYANSNDYYYYSLSKITTPSPTRMEADTFNFGQFYNEGVRLENGDVSAGFKLNYDNLTEGVSFGLSARMQDNRNMYRLEVTPRSTRLVKIVGGVKTVLQDRSYPFQLRSYVDVKLKMNGSRIRGYVGGVPLIDVTDDTFTTGMTGPYSEVEYSQMKDFAITSYSGTNGNTRNTAIVGTPINYIKSYSDPEQDPAIPVLTEWTYNHLQPYKFLDTGDGYSGVSAYHGQTVTAERAVLDKVGVYRVDYRVPDDPTPAGYKYPNPAFMSYSKYSDIHSETVIIHRRPLANFSLTINADKTIAWHDAAYDPDRWMNAWTYSIEPATGIDYGATRGILDRKRNYTTPGGVTVNGQLTRPAEWGWYTVRQAVADEYGAWSEWYEVSIWVEPAPNNPPAVTLTFPIGSHSSPTPVSLKPTISWNQSDPDPGTTFSVFNLSIRDEAGVCIECLSGQAMYTQQGSWAWTMEQLLTMGRKYQVQVQVADDGNLHSPWSHIGWMATNSPPSAYMSYPWGTQAEPTVVSTLRPTLTWSQTDPDPGTVFDYFQIQITNEANTAIVLDTCAVSADCKVKQSTAAATGSWTVSSDLPAGQKLRVRVKVYDQYGSESEWSPQTWMLINRAPGGNLLVQQPIYEHDTPVLTVEASDPDGDALTVRLESSYEGGEFLELQSWSGVSSGDTRQISYGPLQQGMYTLRVTVTDPYGAQYRQTYRVTVLPLELTGWVRHTPDWERYRQEWNAKFPEKERQEDMFWAGEAFLLTAAVTDTGPSSTKPAAVTSELLATGERTELSYEAPTDLYQGMLLNTDHVRTLPQGTVTFRFTVDWSNGLTLHYEVPVRIVGSLYEAMVQQIRH
ncbi:MULTISPECIES: CARDB domain-containing protein [unclassified Paenibacillus]|uniref:glycoside hydrolase family 78 protein n=1 Tax=unclassified Paenibacillus TaxID=185978 RepID=UPI0015A2C71B|nr:MULTISPECIES: CARDB domain-containing protein [unclassified Paenibacillus]